MYYTNAFLIDIRKPITLNYLFFMRNNRQSGKKPNVV